MADQVEKCNVKNILLSKNTFTVMEEDHFVDTKVHVSETTSTIDNVQLQDDAGHYEQYEESTISDNIKVELSSFDVHYNIENDNVKIEEGISGGDIKIEFDDGLLYCEQCLAYYEDYCIKCGMLVHILNRNALNNADDKAGELPNGILEIQESIGQFGVFALKVIPEGVTLGPFTGLNRTECTWKMNSGKFVMYEDNSNQYLNWMQYVNSASNTSEHNLRIFQCENNLYYQSTGQIQQGDELLVYFGEEYEDKLNDNCEVDFIPTAIHLVKDVFACTFCCFGFCSKTYLAKHKTVCFGNAAGGFSIKELTQCPFCKIHLDQKEYSEYHMPYCCDRNVRKFNSPTTPGNQTADVNGRRTRSRLQMYKCEHCKYKTKYKMDLKNHTNQHCEVKTCKCGICNRLFKTKEALELHVENAHIHVEVKEDPEQSTSDYTTAHAKVEHSMSQDELKQLKCPRCEFRTKLKYCLTRHVKANHLKEFNYKCDTCKFRTNLKSNFERHKKTKHLKEYNYKCEVCEFRTNYKHYLKVHIKIKHLKEFNYSCDTCEYRTSRAENLEYHRKTTHLKEFDHKCDVCPFRTNLKSNLERHWKTIHLKEYNYRCDTCEYRTNGKDNLEYHIKTTHLKEFDYKCDACEFRSNIKSNFETHKKAKHLKEYNFKCDVCEFVTNYTHHLKKHIKTKHLKEFSYKCDICDYKTNTKLDIDIHIQSKHLKEFNYICEVCDYKTNVKWHLKRHIQSYHLSAFNNKCALCDYKASDNWRMENHVKTKHSIKFSR